jgi:hypothetical protein
MVYNPGTQMPIPGQPIYPQLFYDPHATSCNVNSTCGSTNDSGKLLTATGAGVTFALPAAGAAGTAGYSFGYDGSHSYTVSTPSGTIYGCGVAGLSVVLSIPVSLSPDGTNGWQCIPLGTQEAAAALGGGSCTGTITATMSPNVTYFYCTTTGATTWAVAAPLPAAGVVTSFSLELTNGGAFTQTWMTGTKWPGGSAPALSASGVDVIVCSTRDAGTTWRCVLAEKGSA